MTKQVIRFGAAVMTTLLALAALWQFRIVVLNVLISLTLAAALRPLANRLVGQGIAMRVGWLLVYLVILIGFGFLLFLLGEVAIHDIQQLVSSVSVQDKWTLPVWLDGGLFQPSLFARLPPPSQLAGAVTGEGGRLVLPAILGFTQGAGGVVSSALVIMFLSIYWSVNQTHFERLWLSLLPSHQRRQARSVWRTMEPDIGAYVRCEIIRGFLAVLLLGLGYWLLGCSYPALLALAGALASLIPVVGAPVAVILAFSVGQLSSVQLGLLTALYALLVLIALGIWVKPRLLHRRWDNPILTVVLLIALADAFGLVGIIVAPAMSVLCQILWRRLVSHRSVKGAAAQISDLKVRQACVWDTIKAMDEPPPPLVASSMERLSHLIEKAEPILHVAQPAEPSVPSLRIAPQARAGSVR